MRIKALTFSFGSETVEVFSPFGLLHLPMWNTNGAEPHRFMTDQTFGRFLPWPGFSSCFLHFIPKPHSCHEIDWYQKVLSLKLKKIK